MYVLLSLWLKRVRLWICATLGVCSYFFITGDYLANNKTTWFLRIAQMPRAIYLLQVFLPPTNIFHKALLGKSKQLVVAMVPAPSIFCPRTEHSYVTDLESVSHQPRALFYHILMLLGVQKELIISISDFWIVVKCYYNWSWHCEAVKIDSNLINKEMSADSDKLALSSISTCLWD